MPLFYAVFALLSLAGLCTSLLIHISAWFGLEILPGNWAFVLHVALFVLWIPLVHFSNKTRPNPTIRNNVDHLLDVLPPWVKPFSQAVVVYAVLHFLFFLWQTSQYPKAKVPHSLVVRGFSGHWLIFYGWSLIGFIGLHRLVIRKDQLTRTF